MHNSRRRTHLGVLTVLALILTSACAGEVGKYRNLTTTSDAAGPGSQPILSTIAPTPGSGVIVSEDPNSNPTGSMSQIKPGDTNGTAVPSIDQAHAFPSGAPTANSQAPLTGSTVGVTKTSVMIGLLYPKSGAYAALATDYPTAVQAAFDKAGPIYGRRLLVKAYDDGTSDPSTIQASEKQMRSQVFAAMSQVSESNVVFAPLADRDQLPSIVANIDEKVALPLHDVFAMPTYWAKQAAILPSFIKNYLHAGDKKIAVVYETTSTAIDAKNVFKEQATALGLKVVKVQPIAQTPSTCTNEAANIQASGAQVVFVLAGPLGAICMVRDSGAIGYHPTWTGLGSSWNLNLVATATGGALNGTAMLGTATTLDTPQGAEYSAAMRQRGHSKAASDDVPLLAYALAKSLIQAIKLAGPNLNRAAFVYAMEHRFSGFDSGFMPPPIFGPGDRQGANSVSVEVCKNDEWTTPKRGWVSTF